ncbi:MAG: DUF411 domain-containing protein [Nitrospira sp.]
MAATKLNQRICAIAIALMVPVVALAAPIKAELYKNPECGCCEEYAQYLRANGYEVTVMPTNDLALISRDAGIPEALEGCHAVFVQDYVVSGHVPVDVVNKLLAERPPIAGIALPGMPAGSPGMNGTKAEPFKIYSVSRSGSSSSVYAVR